MVLHKSHGALIALSALCLALLPLTSCSRSPKPTAADPAADYAEGIRFLHGKGVPKDEKKAYELLRRAANQGHADSLGSVGYFYSVGQVVEKDDAKAREYFFAGAEKGSLTSQANLARFLIDGRGGAKDIARGISLLEEAGQRDYIPAKLMLGEVYYFGEHHGGAPDYQRAFDVAKGPAESGNAHAQNIVGVIIKDRRIPDLDPETGREWLLKAARQGYAKACANLGESGYDSPNREVRIEAIKWLIVGKHLQDVTATYLLDDLSKVVIKPDDLAAAQEQADKEIAALPTK